MPIVTDGHNNHPEHNHRSRRRHSRRFQAALTASVEERFVVADPKAKGDLERQLERPRHGSA